MVLVILPKIIINSNDFYVIIQMGLCIFFMVLWAREYDSGDILVIWGQILTLFPKSIFSILYVKKKKIERKTELLFTEMGGYGAN